MRNNLYIQTSRGVPRVLSINNIFKQVIHTEVHNNIFTANFKDSVYVLIAQPIYSSNMLPVL